MIEVRWVHDRPDDVTVVVDGHEVLTAPFTEIDRALRVAELDRAEREKATPGWLGKPVGS